jgi:hypothetical protein
LGCVPVLAVGAGGDRNIRGVQGMSLLSRFLADFQLAWRGAAPAADDDAAGVAVPCGPGSRLDAAAGLYADAFFDDWDGLSVDCQDDYRRKAAPWLLAIDAVDPLRDPSEVAARIIAALRELGVVVIGGATLDMTAREMADLILADVPRGEAPAVPAPGELFKGVMDRIAAGPTVGVSWGGAPGAGDDPVVLDARCVSGHSWSAATGQICPVCGCANIASLPNGGYIGLRRTDAPFVPMTLTADQQAALRAVADAGQLAASTAREVLEGVTRP